MSANQMIYDAKVSDDASATTLRNRWKNDPLLRVLIRDIFISIQTGVDFPKEIPFIDAIWQERNVRLLDLRGIDLTGVKIGNVDMSYCCLDLSILNRAVFSQTSLQFSTLVEAELKGVTWRNVQASPINADGANFEEANLSNSFCMASSFRGAIFNKSMIYDTAFSGCDLTATSSLSATMSSVETTTALFDRGALWSDSNREREKRLPLTFGFQRRKRFSKKQLEADYRDAAKKYVRENYTLFARRILFVGKIIEEKGGTAKVQILDYENLSTVFKILEVKLDTGVGEGRYLSMKGTSAHKFEANVIPGEGTSSKLWDEVRYKSNFVSDGLPIRLDRRIIRNKIKFK